MSNSYSQKAQTGEEIARRWPVCPSATLGQNPSGPGAKPITSYRGSPTIAF